MSELVQRHMESRAEEVEEMRRTKLFTIDETKSILKKWREFENKINGITKNVQDFKDYIEFEKFLLKQIHCRRDKNKISDRKSAIEYKIRRRIKTLYEIGLQRFASDFPFWLSYFKFCKEFDNVGSASQAAQNMIKHFSFEQQVWIIAAKFYAYDRLEVNIALEILHKGLTLHEDSQDLYKEAIKLELSKVNNSDDILDDAEEDCEAHRICCAKIKTYLVVTLRKIKDFNFYISLLEILEPYTFTIEVQGNIIDHLTNNHAKEDIVWHTLAQREMRGLHHSSMGESVNYCSPSPFIFCVEKYKKGLQKIDSSNKSKLWSYYIEFLIDHQRETTEGTNKKCLKLLKKALEEASSEGSLTEKYYIIWLEYLNDDEAFPVLEKATTALPSSVELWKLRLKAAIFQNNKVEVNKIFKMGVYAVKEKALPLWLMILRFSSLAVNHETVEAIYRDGVKQPEEVSQVLKPKYIEWLALHRTIEEARRVYLDLAQKKPYCKDLHMVMLKMEATGGAYELREFEKIHRLACSQFGKDDLDVWLKYVQFHIEYNRDNDLNEKVQIVYNEAMKNLSPMLTFDFNEKYQNLMTKL